MASEKTRTTVRVTPAEERAVAASAKRLGMSMSARLSEGALAHPTNVEVSAPAGAAKQAADRAGKVIDQTLATLNASRARMAAMERAARSRALARITGCLAYAGKPKTIAEMDAAITAEVKARYRREA